MAVPGPYTPQNMAAQQSPQSQPMAVPAVAAPQTSSQKVVRRGTSKAVPVVISAGLAIGTFSGLLFGLGTGEASTKTTSTSTSEKTEKTKDKPSETPDVLAANVGDGYGDQADVQHRVPETNANKGLVKVVKDDPTKANDPGKVDGKGADGQPIDPKSGSGTGSGSGSASPTPANGSNAPVEAKKSAKVTIEISPANVAATAKVTIDGKDATGGAIDVALEPGQKKSIDLVVVAQGFHEYSQKVTVEGDATVKVELIKRPVVSQQPSQPQTGLPQVNNRPQVPRVNTPPPPTTGNTGSGKKNPPPKPAQGGIIDI